MQRARRKETRNYNTCRDFRSTQRRSRSTCTCRSRSATHLVLPSMLHAYLIVFTRLRNWIVSPFLYGDLFGIYDWSSARSIGCCSICTTILSLSFDFLFLALEKCQKCLEILTHFAYRKNVRSRSFLKFMCRCHHIIACWRQSRNELGPYLCGRKRSLLLSMSPVVVIP